MNSDLTVLCTWDMNELIQGKHYDYYNFLYKHPLTTFILLMASGLAFGAMTLNIFRLVAANWNFITTYGLTALKEGGLHQALELFLTGMSSMIVYLVFKFCERILIDWMRSLKMPAKKAGG